MLKLSHCEIKDITEETKDLVLFWRNQEHIRTVMYNQDLIEKEEHYKWVENLAKISSSMTKVFFYEGEPLGVVSFSKVNNQDFVYEWGFYLGNKENPKGMGTLLALAAIDYFFSENNIRKKIFAEVLAFNERSIYFHEKIGFRHEGVLRQHYYVKGKLQDIYLFGLTRDEWVQQRKILMLNIGLE